MIKRILITLTLLASGVHAQSAGVGQIWTVVSGTPQSGATANGNGTAVNVNGLSSAIYTVNCSVACSGGTTINFEGSGDGSNYVAINAVQLGTGIIASTVVNQGTTITAWQVPIGGLQTIRARISAYSAGTITVTVNATAAPYDPKTIQSNLLIGGTTVDGNSGNKSAQTMRVVLATDQPQLGNKLLVTPDAVALPAGSALIGEAAGVTTPTTTDAASTCYLTSAASTNSTNCKASAGNVYGISVVNTTTTNYFLRMYNASSAPTCSSATGFVETIPALGAAANGGGISRPWVVPQAYSTGIGFCLTGGGSSTDNTNAATGVYVAILYK